MLRSDRSLTERAFEEGALRVLVCTATLAWGVNLPAHTVIIKGTEVYNPEKGGVTDLSILDVLQIFGRAGRPQYDDSGEAILLTTHKSLDLYLSLLAKQTPIESSFIKALPDHLNAEVVAGTVTNVKEAVAWLGYTYLHVRMKKNPMAYGITIAEAEADPQCDARRETLIKSAADKLDSYKMVRYDARSGNLAATDLGRTSSHYYIKDESIYRFNKAIQAHLGDGQTIALICMASEFDQIRIRPEELKDLETLKSTCPLEIRAGLDEPPGKVNVLLQSQISNIRISNFTLVSDANYIAQNSGRVSRALFEIALAKGWSSLARQLLDLSKAIDKKCWWFQTPLRQFPGEIPQHALEELEAKGGGGNVDHILDMEGAEVGALCGVHRIGDKVLHLAKCIPRLKMSITAQTVTRSVLRVTLTIDADFIWSDKYHSTAESWWILVEDGDSERVYHTEHFVLAKRNRHEPHILSFPIPVFEPLPTQYWVRALSDSWLGCETVAPLSFKHLILPDRHPAHTPLLDLNPLPISALQDPNFMLLFKKYSHFNPIQTQLFHVLYNTDKNVLLGAPTGSGKTAVAEICVLRMILEARKARATDPRHSGSVAVYIAPLKALARERLKDWKHKFGSVLGLTVLELTGDVAPDTNALRRADIIITTPEKWDGVTRGWKDRSYVSRAALLIMDEVHLLGEERGPVLEVIVSRMRHISASTGRGIRFVGLSTALANARDLADWLGVTEDGVGLYNFRPSVRPIPCVVHIQGYPGKHYCPRMATMNKPTYAAIMEHSPDKPVLVFVASRRQTRLTALDLISLCVSSDAPKQFLKMPEEEAAECAQAARDPALRHTLPFGIAIHHAGLEEGDRNMVEKLFEDGKLQVLVCTSTLAWGVNFPAHLVVVKGTEYFDGRIGRYVDFPITDVLQMIGRAGRPQYDTSAVAVILVHEPKKNFYKKFLYEPFPVESQLAGQLANHINAEIAGGAVTSREDALKYMTWTYLFRRLVQNPSYYGLEDSTPNGVQEYLQDLIDKALKDLEESYCIQVEEKGAQGDGLSSTAFGRIASYYYLDHTTVRTVASTLDSAADSGTELELPQLARLLADAHEFSELPVRHNEELLNAELSHTLPWPVAESEMGEANAKAFLLIQAHLLRAKLPISDYTNDTKSVLDQAFRVLNAMIDVAAHLGLLHSTLTLMHLGQLIAQALPLGVDPLKQLPGCESDTVQGTSIRASIAKSVGINNRNGTVNSNVLKMLLSGGMSKARRVIENVLGKDGEATRAMKALAGLPLVTLSAHMAGSANSNILEVEEDAEYELSVTLSIAQGTGTERLPLPRNSKARELGFWIVLGTVPEKSSKNGELLAVKRLGKTTRGAMTTTLMFQPPTSDVNLQTGSKVTMDVVLYAIADAAIGVDAEVVLPMVVTGRRLKSVE